MIKMYTTKLEQSLCKSKNLEILGKIFITVIHSHIYPFLTGSNLPDNFS